MNHDIEDPGKQKMFQREIGYTKEQKKPFIGKRKKPKKLK